MTLDTSYGWRFVSIDILGVERLIEVDLGGTLTWDQSRDVRKTIEGLAFRPEAWSSFLPGSDLIRLDLERDGEVNPLGTFRVSDATERPMDFDDSVEPVTLRALAVPLSDQTIRLRTGTESPVFATAGSDPTVLIRTLLDSVGLPHAIPSTAQVLAEPIGWSPGTPLSTIVSDLALLAGHHGPWQSNDGIVRTLPVEGVVQSDVPDLHDLGVQEGSVGISTPWLSAPNRVVVADTSGESPIVGVWNAPVTAPHSKVNRGFLTTQVVNQQGLTGEGHAAAVAATIGTQAFARQLNATIIPTHMIDGFEKVAYLGRIWRVIRYSIQLTPGGLLSLTAVEEGAVEVEGGAGGGGGLPPPPTPEDPCGGSLGACFIAEMVLHGPEGWWRYNDLGPNPAADASGNGFDAIWIGNPLFCQTPILGPGSTSTTDPDDNAWAEVEFPGNDLAGVSYTLVASYLPKAPVGSPQWDHQHVLFSRLPNPGQSADDARATGTYGWALTVAPENPGNDRRPRLRHYTDVGTTLVSSLANEVSLPPDETSQVVVVFDKDEQNPLTGTTRLGQVTIYVNGRVAKYSYGAFGPGAELAPLPPGNTVFTFYLDTFTRANGPIGNLEQPNTPWSNTFLVGGSAWVVDGNQARPDGLDAGTQWHIAPISALSKFLLGSISLDLTIPLAAPVVGEPFAGLMPRTRTQLLNPTADRTEFGIWWDGGAWVPRFDVWSVGVLQTTLTFPAFPQVAGATVNLLVVFTNAVGGDTFDLYVDGGLVGSHTLSPVLDPVLQDTTGLFPTFVPGMFAHSHNPADPWLFDNFNGTGNLNDVPLRLSGDELGNLSDGRQSEMTMLPATVLTEAEVADLWAACQVTPTQDQPRPFNSRTANVSGTAANGAQTVAVPGGAKEGDLLTVLAQVGTAQLLAPPVFGSELGITAPAGWTVHLYDFRADTPDGGATYDASAWMLASKVLTAADVATPFQVVGFSTVNTVGGNSRTFVGMATWWEGTIAVPEPEVVDLSWVEDTAYGENPVPTYTYVPPFAHDATWTASGWEIILGRVTLIPSGETPDLDVKPHRHDLNNHAPTDIARSSGAAWARPGETVTIVPDGGPLDGTAITRISVGAFIGQGSLGPVFDCATLPAAGTYGLAVLAESPDGWWRHAETSGPIACDSSGNGNDGAYQGTMVYSQPSLVVPAEDDAIGLGVATGRMQVPVLPNLAVGTVAPAGSFTMMMLVRPEDQTPGDKVLLGQLAEVAAGNGTAMMWTGEGQRFKIVRRDGVTNDEVTNAIMQAPDRARHLAMTYDVATGDWTLFLDGDQIEGLNSVAALDAAAMAGTFPTVGAASDDSGLLAGNAVVDHTSVWEGSALTPATIQSLAGDAGLTPTSPRPLFVSEATPASAIAAPAGAAVGDLLIVTVIAHQVLGVPAGVPTITAPAGWTLMGSSTGLSNGNLVGSRQSSYWKIATAGDLVGAFGFTATSAVGPLQFDQGATCTAWRHFDVATPISNYSNGFGFDLPNPSGIGVFGPFPTGQCVALAASNSGWSGFGPNPPPSMWIDSLSIAEFAINVDCGLTASWADEDLTGNCGVLFEGSQQSHSHIEIWTVNG